MKISSAYSTHRSSDVLRVAKKIAEYEGLENGEKLERRTSFEKVK